MAVWVLTLFLLADSQAVIASADGFESRKACLEHAIREARRHHDGERVFYIGVRCDKEMEI